MAERFKVRKLQEKVKSDPGESQLHQKVKLRVKSGAVGKQPSGLKFSLVLISAKGTEGSGFEFH